MRLIDGKSTASAIRQEIASEVRVLLSNGGRRPHLAAVLVGHDGGSETYVANKIKACEECGFRSSLIRYEADVTEAELLACVARLNADEGVDGFIVQLPLPGHIDEAKVTEAISPDKDVDGFHPVNIGRLTLGEPCFVSATPQGIMTLLERYGVSTAGRSAVVIGRSNIVGRPLSILLSQKGVDATVTLCHSRTPDLAAVCRRADIVVAALGRPGFVSADMVKEGAVVIDVGTTRVADPTAARGWRLKGDVDFAAVSPKCELITPVPGGVGPMTICSLMQNTLKSYKRRVGDHNKQ